MKASKVMVRKMSFSPLLFTNFIKNVNIWWDLNYKGGDFGISIFWA
jgi:hypothetical protein